MRKGGGRSRAGDNVLFTLVPLFFLPRQIRIWAVVRIQRAVRRWLQINHERRRARLRQWEDKRRWKKKLGDSDYRSGRMGRSLGGGGAEDKRIVT